MLFLLAFVAVGVFLIASPEFLAQDDDELLVAGARLEGVAGEGGGQAEGVDG